MDIKIEDNKDLIPFEDLEVNMIALNKDNTMVDFVGRAGVGGHFKVVVSLKSEEIKAAFELCGQIEGF